MFRKRARIVVIGGMFAPRLVAPICYRDLSVALGGAPILELPYGGIGPVKETEAVVGAQLDKLINLDEWVVLFAHSLGAVVAAGYASKRENVRVVQLGAPNGGSLMAWPLRFSPLWGVPSAIRDMVPGSYYLSRYHERVVPIASRIISVYCASHSWPVLPWHASHFPGADNFCFGSQSALREMPSEHQVDTSWHLGNPNHLTLVTDVTVRSVAISALASQGCVDLANLLTPFAAAS